MELDEHGFLEELLSLRRETQEAWDSFPLGMADLFTADSGLGCSFDDNLAIVPPSFNATPSDLTVDCTLADLYSPYASSTTTTFLSAVPELHSSTDLPHRPAAAPAAAEPSKRKRIEGLPSKNLMAERRRRKRLNDRLSMLRSVVPKISKMDRTAILGDTIDYVKELLERIKGLQGEMEPGSEHGGLLGAFREMGPNEVLVRNSPKFDAERRGEKTRIEICCAAKPGLLLSTVGTLEALGLEIEQCVVSCFNDFGMQASCSEEMEQRSGLTDEEIKQALFRNAGYGGRCL